MKSASHSLLNSLDVMCVLCIICYRMQEGWAHVCPFIMWCHEKKKLCRQKKRAWFIPVDILVPCNYCTVSAAMSQPPISRGFAFRDGWLAWEVAELSPHTPLWRDTPLAVKRNTPSWHSACNNNNNWPSLFFWVDPPSWKKVAAHHMCVFDLCRFFTMI